MIHWLSALLFGIISAAVAAEPLKITVAVPGPGTGSYFPIEIIPRIGADRAEGAEVKLNLVPGGGVAIEQMLTNNADIAVVGLPAAMSARLKDPRVVTIAAVNDLPLYALLVRWGLKDQVRSVADLKGRTVGVHSNSLSSKTNSHQLLELVLARNDVDADAVRTVAVGQRWQSEAAMLSSGDADAVMGDEPYASRMEDEKIAYVLMHLGNPEHAKAMPGAGFLRAAVIARSDRIERDPKKAETMVRIVKRVLDWLAKTPPETIVETAGLAGTVEGRYFLDVLRKYPRQYSKDGKFSTRQLRETETFFHESQGHNPAARGLKIESMVIDRWAGRKD